MTTKDTKTASLEALRAMKDQGQTKPAREDAKVLDLPEGFWDDAEVQAPLTKQQINMRVDPDIIAFFKAQGSGHLTRMHAVLRSYVDAQRKRHSPR